MKWDGCWRGIWRSPEETPPRPRPRPTSAFCWRTCAPTRSGTARQSPLREAGTLLSACVRSRLKRCVGNLVANAQRHADHVRMLAKREQRFVSIIVDDDGEGIPAAHREEVFRPFYRLDEARNQDESGAGLGLAIARDIARSHGGDIVLADSPMGGLRAVIRIPV